MDTIPEASGLAASARNAGVLYIVNDNPGTREVWAVRTDGSLIGAITFTDTAAVDVESLEIGACADGSTSQCVYVADIGDNAAERADVRVWRFPEPDLSAGVPGGIVAADVITLTYPDGARNAEAVLVDEAGVPYIVTKQRRGADDSPPGPPELYAAPGFADGELIARGSVELPSGGVVTGAAARPGRVLLRTYSHLFEYVAPDTASMLDELGTWPATSVPVASEPQGEAVAYAADGCGTYTVSEQVGDIWFSRCTAPPPDVVRRAGDDRVETAVAVSRAAFAPRVPGVVVATVDAFPDALAGGPLASALGGPVLLTSSDRLPEVVAEELVRLDPGCVIVLGGRSAVAGDVLTALEAAVDVPVERVAGPERTATAAAASRAAFPDGAGTAFVATAAAAAGAPLLLVDGAVPPATAAELQRLEPERVVALGGAAAIPPAVADELAAVAGAPVERREGPDRYGTAAAAVAALSAATVDTVYVASGADYPDALVAGPAVAAEGGALLLVSPTAVPQPTAAALESLEPSRIVLLGGPAAIQGSVEDDLRAYVR